MTRVEIPEPGDTDLCTRLHRGLEQAKSGELAEGTGREAMERAFERAKRESDNHGATK